MSIDKDFKYKGGAINMELAERFSHRSAKDVANAASSARRTATQIETQLRTYEFVLNAEQLLALRAAVSVTAKLAADLTRLKPWAVAYEKFGQEKFDREYEQALVAEGAKHWATDAEALSEAEDLLAFHAKGHAGEEAETFLLSIHAGHKSVWRDTSSGLVQRALEVLPAALAAGDADKVRRNATTVLRDLGQGFSSNSGTWFVGRSDYIAWRQVRARARAAAGAALLNLRKATT